jgi:hypothetical protein
MSSVRGAHPPPRCAPCHRGCKKARACGAATAAAAAAALRTRSAPRVRHRPRPCRGEVHCPLARRKHNLPPRRVQRVPHHRIAALRRPNDVLHSERVSAGTHTCTKHTARAHINKPHTPHTRTYTQARAHTHTHTHTHTHKHTQTRNHVPGRRSCHISINPRPTPRTCGRQCPRT